MKKAFHSDKAKIVGKLTKTKEGYLTGTAIIAREGILTYNEGGRVVRKLITRDELSKPESINSLKMKPITNDHPPVMLDASNAKQYQAGSHGDNIRVDDGLLLSPVTITDKKAVFDVMAGKREMSAGYWADIEETPGTWNGQPYDCIQRNRDYNHSALCSDSRAGEVTRLHLDSNASIECGEPDFKHFDSIDNNLQRSDLMKCTINGVTGEFNEQQIADHITQQDAKISTMTKEHKDAIDVLAADRDNWKDKHTQLDSKVKADLAALPAQISTAAKARIDLERSVTPYLDKADAEKIGSFTDADLKKKAILKAFPNVQLDDKTSDVYIQGRYESALDVLKDSHFDAAAAANRQKTNSAPKKTTDSHESVASKEESEKKICDRYKTTTNRDSIMKA